MLTAIYLITSIVSAMSLKPSFGWGFGMWLAYCGVSLAVIFILHITGVARLSLKQW